MSQIDSINSALDRLVSTVGELPASPAILSAVMGMTSNLDTRLDDLTEVLSSDVSLTAQVLKLSNSSFYGRAKEVTTLQEAVPILGFFALRSMVMASSAHTMFSDDNPNSTRSRLWRHSLASAVTARQIARAVKYQAVEEAFVAALLHDIGKLVLIKKLPQRYDIVVKGVEEDGKSFYEMETEVFGFSHCDVGSVLLDQWSFPTSLIMAVGNHHEPPAPNEEDPIPLAHLVCLGNQLCKHFKVGFNEILETELAELPSSKVLNLDEDALKEILQLSREHYQVEISILP